jgi:hypothetical protein
MPKVVQMKKLIMILFLIFNMSYLQEMKQIGQRQELPKVKEKEKEMIVRGHLYANPSVEYLEKESKNWGRGLDRYCAKFFALPVKDAEIDAPIVDELTEEMGARRYIITGELGKQLKPLCPKCDVRYNYSWASGSATMRSSIIVKIRGMVHLSSIPIGEKIGEEFIYVGNYILDNGELLEIEFLPPLEIFKSFSDSLTPVLTHYFWGFHAALHPEFEIKHNPHTIDESIRDIEKALDKLKSIPQKEVKVDVPEETILMLKKINPKVKIITTYNPVKTYIEILEEGLKKFKKAKVEKEKQSKNK